MKRRVWVQVNDEMTSFEIAPGSLVDDLRSVIYESKAFSIDRGTIKSIRLDNKLLKVRDPVPQTEGIFKVDLKDKGTTPPSILRDDEILKRVKQYEKIELNRLFSRVGLKLRHPFQEEDMLIFEMIETFEKDKSCHRFLIRGNPGIGNTYFLYWCLLRFISENKVVVWNRGAYDLTVKCFNSPLGQARKSKDITDFESELKDPNTIYLVDSVPNPGEVSAFTILAASPRKDNYKQFERYPNVTSFFMPLWAYGELQQVYNTNFSQKMSETEFERRYKIFPGVPRFIFESIHELELLKALERSTFFSW
eukprot:TRINITY_DN9816_c0_g1_i5.p1 TRINITY_DN9816_c0_g1~~TRINITY_DN9816_c0_g1_i5.p1  ORF type:complete len:307 (-),score=30.60 TRINITY_DN9816_c0_g1_i5:837-1757(-)